MTFYFWDVNIKPVQNIELSKKKGGKRMAFNYDKLKGKIVELFGTQYRFAEAMGWSERTLSMKMNGAIPWKQTDICKAIELLNLEESDIPIYFFNAKVQNI